MRKLTWTGAFVLAGLLLASGLGLSARMSAQTSDQPGAQPGGQNPGGQRRGGGFGGRGGGQAVQGTVTAASGNKLTVKTDAGDSYDISLSDGARVMENGQAIKLSDIKPGDSVMAMGQVDAAKKTVEARMVNATDAATVAKARENLGRTYISGRITAIDAENLKITVMRRDNVSQAIAVDDGTSFQRGNSGVAADYAAAGGSTLGGGMRMGRQGAQGAPPAPESITLADIKVGDAVMATGTLKGGAFTVLKMGVSEPGAGPGAGGGQRRRVSDDQTAPPASSPPAPAVPPQQ